MLKWSFAPRWHRSGMHFLHVEAEMHYIAILHHIFLTLDTELAGLAHAGLASEGHIVVILDYLGTDKSLLEVGMDDTGTLWSLGPRMNVQARTSSGPAVK